jgi:hypothetical protein
MICGRVTAVAVLALCSGVLPGCKASDIRRLSYEGTTIKYEFDAGLDEETVKQVLRAYIKKVGMIKNAAPVSVESLSEEWRERCLAVADLRQVLGEYCGAEFLVARQYNTHGRYKNHDRHFILKVCEAGKCDFRISDDFAPDE